ncbi:MAG TPA: hypothetical protein DIW44_03675 [Anaerolineaceae bacterium]|nr:hypothetical protein [Anaerolineaceae bacterium]
MGAINVPNTNSINTENKEILCVDIKIDGVFVRTVYFYTLILKKFLEIILFSLRTCIEEDG